MHNSIFRLYQCQINKNTVNSMVTEGQLNFIGQKLFCSSFTLIICQGGLSTL